MNPWWKLEKEYTVKDVDNTTVKDSGVYYNKKEKRYQAVYVPKNTKSPKIVASIPEGMCVGSKSHSEEVFWRLFTELEKFKGRSGAQQKTGQYLVFFESNGVLKEGLVW